MNELFVLYDSRCGVCSRLRRWMLEQPAYVPIEFIAAGSERARQLFPELPHTDEPEELVVITDEGEVFTGDAAWITCLYALVEFRDWSFRLARPSLRRLARAAWEVLSKNRNRVSHMLSLASDAELQRTFEREKVAC